LYNTSGYGLLRITAAILVIEYVLTITCNVSVLMIAEFENAVRCTSYQHPQMQQPLYMMSAGAGKMNM